MGLCNTSRGWKWVGLRKHYFLLPSHTQAITLRALSLPLTTKEPEALTERVQDSSGNLWGIQYVSLIPLHNLSKARKAGQVHLLSHTYLKILKPDLPTCNAFTRPQGHCPHSLYSQNIYPMLEFPVKPHFQDAPRPVLLCALHLFQIQKNPKLSPQSWAPLPIVLLYSLGPSVFSCN